MQTSHIYPGAYSLNAYLTVKDSNEAIAFYKKAFGATEKGKLVMPDGKVGHAEILVEGSLLMMADENMEWGNKSPHTLGGSPVAFSLYVKNVDEVFQRAVDAGATVILAVEDKFYGDRVGELSDPFGYKWLIATHKEDMDFDEMQSRMEKLFVDK